MSALPPFEPAPNRAANLTAAEVLSASGPVARMLGGGFEPRPEQQAMANAVEMALRDKSRLLVEAGTGVGKSFAYLVPAMLRCVLHKERVVIATNTISLQEQLIEKDIPFLMNVIDDWLDKVPGLVREQLPALVPVLVKGRGNYMSIRRLKLASERQTSLFGDASSLRSLHVIEEWAGNTHEGTLATLPPLEAMEVWDHVRSDSDNCMGRKCEHFKECFFQNARREMEKANLLVCNHALFFSDLALRSRSTDGGPSVGLLPSYQHLVLDEAHNIEDVACEHFGITLTQPRVNRLLRTLFQPRRGKGYLSERALALADADAVSRAMNLVSDAEMAAREFFDALLDVWEKDTTRTGRIRGSGIVRNTLTPTMRALSLHLKTLRETVKSEPDKFELNSYAKRAADIADAAEMLVEQSIPQAVYWVEAQSSHRRQAGGAAPPRHGPVAFPRVTMACSPIEAGPILRQHLFSRDMGIVLTSATLSTRAIRPDELPERAETAFAYTMTQLGCENALTMQLGSPFDYAKQMQLYVDTTMPSPRGGGKFPPGPGAGTKSTKTTTERRYVDIDVEEMMVDAPKSFAEELASRVLQHVKATDGGAFVLFTSFADLFAVADLLEQPLKMQDIPVLVQGRDGARSQILQRFRENDRSVLLGAASFWQGVDVRGSNLRNVIITRLPFDPPDRPLTQARLERIEQRGGNAFMEESLPRAVIRFKQGFGRLIRSKTDTGRVVVLDPRILTARYGKRFLDALPEGVRAETIE